MNLMRSHVSVCFETLKMHLVQYFSEIHTVSGVMVIMETRIYRTLYYVSMTDLLLKCIVK